MPIHVEVTNYRFPLGADRESGKAGEPVTGIVAITGLADWRRMTEQGALNPTVTLDDGTRFTIDRESGAAPKRLEGESTPDYFERTKDDEEWILIWDVTFLTSLASLEPENQE